MIFMWPNDIYDRRICLLRFRCIYFIGVLFQQKSFISQESSKYSMESTVLLNSDWRK